MRARTCQVCGQTFDEADRRWDEAFRTGQCPFCSGVGTLTSSVRGASTQFGSYGPIPAYAARRPATLLSQTFRWAFLAFPCAIPIGSFMALVVSRAWDFPVVLLIVVGLRIGTGVFFYGFPLLWLILLAAGSVMRLQAVEARVGRGPVVLAASVVSGELAALLLQGALWERKIPWPPNGYALAFGISVAFGVFTAGMVTVRS
jgi:hypothetical protein